jgi:hypothetical protein
VAIVAIVEYRDTVAIPGSPDIADIQESAHQATQDIQALAAIVDTLVSAGIQDIPAAEFLVIPDTQEQEHLVTPDIQE